MFKSVRDSRPGTERLSKRSPSLHTGDLCANARPAECHDAKCREDHTGDEGQGRLNSSVQANGNLARFGTSLVRRIGWWKNRLSSFDVKILITLPYGVRWSSSSDQGIAEDLGEVGILAEVLRLELEGTDFGVGTAQVTRFPVRSKAAFDVGHFLDTFLESACI